MKYKIILALAISVATFNSFAQSTAGSFEYRPNFSGIVVRNMDTSIQWYKSVLSLGVTRKSDDANTRFALLESSGFTLELLEIKGTIDRLKIMDETPQGTLMQGYLKIGFKVTDMDACLKHLANLNIKVPRVWTDSQTGKRNFLITDPDKNYIQFFD